MKILNHKLILGCVMLGITSGLLMAIYQPQFANKAIVLLQQTGIVHTHTETLYASLYYDEMFEYTDMIVVGKVASISKSSWNQDNGLPLLDPEKPDKVPPVTPLQLHTVDLVVGRYLVDKLGLAGKLSTDQQQTIQLVNLGTSPIEEGADYKLSIGDTILVFVRQTDIVWLEGGQHKILSFLNAPELSYFRQEVDGSFSGTKTTDLGQGEFRTEASTFSLDAVVEDIQKHPALKEFEVKQ